MTQCNDDGTGHELHWNEDTHAYTCSECGFNVPGEAIQSMFWENELLDWEKSRIE